MLHTIKLHNLRYSTKNNMLSTRAIQTMVVIKNMFDEGNVIVQLSSSGATLVIQL